MEKSLNQISPMARYRIWRSGPIKRAIDLTLSSIALIWLAPLFCLIAIWIKRDSPGPVFYRGARMGRNGLVFKILKFRTMYETKASYSGPKVTAHDDPRVTPLGRWLRDTKLNELPQFWNVFKGEMSLVGPRPEDPSIALNWPAAVREQVLSVRPGITSPASVLYRNEETLLCAEDVFRQYVGELVPDKLRLDQLYVQHRSFCLDLDTLLWTALILLPRVGSTETPEKLLFVGPFTRFIRRYVSWFVGDLFVTLVAAGFVGVIWRMNEPLNVGWPKSIAAALALALLFSVTGAVLGVNRIVWSKAALEDIYDLVAAWAVAALLAFAANLAIHLLPLGLIAISSILALGGFIAIRYRGRLATGIVCYITRRRIRALGASRARADCWLRSQCPPCGMDPGSARKFE